METDEAPTDPAAPSPSSNDNDVNMQDAKATADTPGTENGMPEAGDKPVQMDTDTKVHSKENIFVCSNYLFLTVFLRSSSISLCTQIVCF